MIWLMGALALLGGVLNTVMSGSNATLAKTLHQPMLAAVVVAASGAIFYLAIAPFYGVGWPDRQDILAGGMFGGLSFRRKARRWNRHRAHGDGRCDHVDRHGPLWLVGFKPHSLHWPRIVGASLMVLGLVPVAVNYRSAGVPPTLLIRHPRQG